MEHFDDNLAGGRQSLTGIQQHPSTMEAGGHLFGGRHPARMTPSPGRRRISRPKSVKRGST